MGIAEWFRGWFIRRRRSYELSSVERVARAAELLEGNGRLQEASVILGEGIKRFPQATNLRTQQERVERRRLKERVAELNKLYQARPDPALAVELVRIYRETGDSVSARSVVEEAIKRFPNHAPLYEVKGDLWLEIFEASGTEPDGMEAMRSLERCVELDPANLTAREALVGLYGKIGAWAKALHHAVLVLNTLRPGVVGRVAIEALAKHAPPEEDVGVLMHNFARTHEKTTAPLPERRTASKILELFHDLKGRRLAAMIATDGSLIDIVSNERIDKEAIAQTGNALISAAVECCTRMSLGSFVTAQIEGEGTSAYLKVLTPQDVDATSARPARSTTILLLTNDLARKREILARLAHT